MPRKSLEALSIMPTPDQYPEPPADMGPEQADQWRLIVRRMPPDWFTVETQPLLRQLVQHTYTSKVVHERIVEFEAGLSKDKSTQELDRLSRMQDRERKAITSLSTKLRLTQQSRHVGTNAHGVSTVIKNAVPPRSWKTFAEDEKEHARR